MSTEEGYPTFCDTQLFCAFCEFWTGSDAALMEHVRNQHPEKIQRPTPAPIPASDSPVLDLKECRRDVAEIRLSASLQITPSKERDIAEIGARYDSLIAEVERLRALHASTEGAPQENYAIRALDAACLWEPARMRELADTIERYYAICEAQYLRGIANRLEAAEKFESQREATEGAPDDIAGYWKAQAEAFKKEASEANQKLVSAHRDLEELVDEQKATEGALRQVVERLLEALEAAEQFIEPEIPRGPATDGWMNTKALVAEARESATALLALPLGGERRR
jgi:ElaB/YqjD/DUF883 family membrane-anchored ribosome-binding protein